MDGQGLGRAFLQPSSTSCLKLNSPRTAAMYDRPGREGPPTTGIPLSCVMRLGQRSKSTVFVAVIRLDTHGIAIPYYGVEANGDHEAGECDRLDVLCRHPEVVRYESKLGVPCGVCGLDARSEGRAYIYHRFCGLPAVIRINLWDGLDISRREVVRARLESAVQHPEVYFRAGRTRDASPIRFKP